MQQNFIVFGISYCELMLNSTSKSSRDDFEEVGHSILGICGEDVGVHPDDTEDCLDG
jgi:hypothetical protein